MYIYMYISLSLSISLSLYIYILCVYIYIYIYMYKVGLFMLAVERVASGELRLKPTPPNFSSRLSQRTGHREPQVRFIAHRF